MEVYREKCQIAMSAHVAARWPTEPGRFGRILLVLGRVQRINPKVIEKAFFSQEIGSVPIRNLVQNIFRCRDKDVMQ